MARGLFLFGCLLLLGLTGCNGSHEYFPLEVGKTWTYSVWSEMATFVEDIKVVERVPIGNVNGYRLDGPLGMSRVAWRNGRLISDNLPNTRISPPITLLAPRVKEKIRWSGVVEMLGRSFDAEGTLEQIPDKVPLGARKYESIKAILRIKVGNKNIELLTWYAPDMGLVRQEQRTDGNLNYRMEYLAHS